MTLGATSAATPTAPAVAPATVEFKLVTFNILAPCYKTEAASGELESANPENYLRRNRDICSLLLAQKADIICIQEFWAANEEVRACYVDTLNKEGYSHREVRRTSHWRTRKDGLACFVKDERIVLQDSRDIFFHDAGDRVAQLMLLAIQDPEPSPSSSSAASNRHQQPKPKTPPQQFLVVNTHLLFPHNEFSSKIRMRETTKVLGFVESYRQREMCADVCGRSDVRVPVILTGDLNGSPRGRVYQYIRSQNYRSAMQEKWQAEGPEGQQKWAQWVSHRNHREQIASVDHVFFLNPTDQEEGRLPPVPDWTNLVFREVLERIRERHHYDTDAATGAGAGAGAGSGQGTSASAGTGTGASQGKKGGSGGSGGGLGLADETALRRAFDDFDEDHSQFVTRQEFEASLLVLGFGSEGEPALTPEEIDLLVETADKNGDGLIDFREFCDRFERALACDEDDDDCVPFSRSTWLVDDLSVGSRERRVAAEAVGRGRGGGGGGGGGGDGGGDGDAEAAQQQQQQQQQQSQGLLSADQDGAARGAGLGPSASERARQAVLERVLLQQAAGTGAQPSAADLSSLAVISKELPDARPMGNLSVRRASIWPPALERGEWPADWTLSDHGMVSVEFSGEVSSS